MLRNITSIIFGTILGMSAMMIIHSLSFIIIPLPEGVIFPPKSDEEIKLFNMYLETASSGSFILAIISHFLGAFFASIISFKISMSKEWMKKKSSIFIPIIIGLIFTYTGWVNFNSIPHPDWFIVDLLFYVPAAYLGFYLFSKKS